METQYPMDIAWRFTVETADANKVSHAHIPTNVQNAPSDTPSTAHAPQTQTTAPPSQVPQQTPQKLKSNPTLPTQIKPGIFYTICLRQKSTQIPPHISTRDSLRVSQQAAKKS